MGEFKAKMNKALIKFDEYRLTKADLEKLSDDQRAALAVFCFAVSEINSLMRLFLFSEQSLSEKPEIVSAIAIQRNVLIRTMSSKLIEFREFLGFQGKYNQTKDSGLLDFKKLAETKLGKLDGHEGFKFAKKIRHEAAFHYNLKPIRARLDWVHGDAQRSLHVHKMNGNGFFPFGEEVLFIGLINELVGSTEDKSDARELIDKWADWSSWATRAVNELFADYVDKFVFSLNPGRHSGEVCYWIDPELVGIPGEKKIPVFVGFD